MTNAAKPSCNGLGDCPSVNRRDFLRAIGLGTAVMAGGMPLMAGPVETAEFEKILPADKKLSPEWIQSLLARGARTVYRGVELEKIGMPVGGICTGQVYLGGDGRLWHWDIFNQFVDSGCGGPHYASPPSPAFPFEQGFSLRVVADGKSQVRALDRRGFADISFVGEYPIGRVEYRDSTCPVTATLEAFSPFIPLNPEDSHLPATIMQFTVKNDSQAKVDGELAGWLENAVCLHSAQANIETRTNTIARRQGLTAVSCTAAVVAESGQAERPPIGFADFENEDYSPWKVEGDAFGNAPAQGAPDSIQKLSAHTGKGLANSWTGSDALRGKLISPPFTIERPFISFLIGGGNHPNETCIHLVVDGQTVRSATGRNSDAMTWADWCVDDLTGKTAHLEIVDQHSGDWGHIDIDQIEFGDRPRIWPGLQKDRSDFGSMCLALLDARPDDLAAASVASDALPQCLFDEDPAPSFSAVVGKSVARPIGALARKFSLKPGEQATITFVVAWWFPNIQHLGLQGIDGRKYGKRFASAEEVVGQIATHFDQLAGQTRLWHDTWYDSTLPYWFLDRTFQNISTLATSTAYWFGNNRFYGWEGVGSCPGTCTHVWHYAQAVGRIFPSLERTTREMVDYGIAFHEATGAMGFRAEFDMNPAVDGQAGTILRAYREHQMSADDAFLKRNWPRIKKSLQWLIDHDVNKDGILDGAQHNTLDAAWFGQIAWLSSLYVAALLAGEQMAMEMGDEGFAKQARSIAEAGTQNIDKALFNGEYYVQVADKDHSGDVGSYGGCEIDQVFGQSWAYQVGLERVLPRKNTLTALRSLWKYNFTPDVGVYRKAHEAGRWYAMPGEGGLLMCTWPQGDRRKPAGPGAWADGYFNECMSGFEYQVAGHMVWEGMVQEGLAITRAIHDRYHASRRNPWNEIECGDHYARAMASYGVFVAACGFEYHGPKGYLAFAPRLTPEAFRAAFTAAEGWGSLHQHREEGKQTQQIEVRYGKLRLTSLGFQLADGAGATNVTVRVGGKNVPATFRANGADVRIKLDQPVTIEASSTLDVLIETSKA